MAKILIVDDDTEICDLLDIFLSGKGYQVLTITSGESALDGIRRQKPDIVLLDIKLPGLDGIKCLGKIKEIDPKIKVIIISAVNDPSYKQSAFSSGADDYIVKPLDLDYVETCVLINSP